MASPLAYGSGLDPTTLPVPILIYIGLAVTTMLGLDTGQWLGFSRVDRQLSFAPDFSSGATSVMALSPVPQGWSIGIELLFYLVAPFVLIFQQHPFIRCSKIN